jgi:hypothetical protein
MAIPAKLTVEHVMPQKWQTFWPLPIGLDPAQHDEALVERQSRIHRLGNLTLTTMPLNASMQNAAWSVKQKELNASSKLLLNTRLIEEHPDVFDEAAIDARSAVLADMICTIWPGPDAWDEACND